MTTTHPRRALVEAEAAAWLDLHRGWDRGLPAEVRDTRVVGQETWGGDGRGCEWYRVDGTFVGAPSPAGQVVRGLSDWAPGWERWSGWSVAASDWGAAERRGPACAVRPAAVLPVPAVGDRLVARDLEGWGPLPAAPRLPVPAAPVVVPTRESGSELLRPVTVVLGQRVPDALRYDRLVSSAAASRRAGLTQAFGDLDGHGDTRWVDTLAAAELREWLRVDAGLTERELEALDRRAAGVAQPTRSDRETLARAQRRARAALA